MKKLSVSVLVFALASASVLACPGEKFQIGQVTLDAEGVLTRTDYTLSAEGEKATIDRITIGQHDEVTLNAAPGMMDASVQIHVLRESQKRDVQGIFSTTYRVRETWTSYWGKPSTSEKTSRVTVHGNYRGEGKRAHTCGKVEVVAISASR